MRFHKMTSLINLQNYDVFDVVVVGAGPSGAAAAKRLVEGRANVLIIEKGIVPRFKMCGGLVAPEAQRLVRGYFGEIPEAVRCRPNVLEGYKVFFSETNCMEFPIEMLGSTGEVVHIWRDKFDLWLAESSGAKLRDNCRFVSYCCDADTITIFVRDRDREKEIKARYLLGADGADSAVRKVLYPDFRSKLKWLPIYEEWYEGRCDLDPNWVYSFLISQENKCWGALGHHDELLQVSVSSGTGRDVKAAFRRFCDYMESRHGLQVDKTVRKAGCIQNNMGRSGQFIFGSGNVLLAGEAAGLLNMSSEGITPALASGHIAGDAILESMRENTSGIDAYLPNIAVERDKTIESHRLAKSVFKQG